MTTPLVIAFGLCGVSLLCSLLIYLNHRRSGTPIPRYEIGAMAGSVGLPLGIAGISPLFSDGIAMALVIAGLLLTIGGAVMVGRARRALRAGSR
ncbi:MAG: hypothetical protein IT353_24080 [Gemmatimonadaceae bacterium]|nr:hypothetical protein [Gemmatimonadaceae bacterium]